MTKKCHICGNNHNFMLFTINDQDYYICDNCQWDKKIDMCNECNKWFFATDLTFDPNFFFTFKSILQ